MFKEPPRWSPDCASATVLMDYLQRVSPQFVAAELDKLGLLNAADEAAAATFARVMRTESRVRQRLAAMVALAMCAMVLVIAQTRYVGAIHLLQDDGSQFMQLAGPTPEW
jgi:hypothetical protein